MSPLGDRTAKKEWGAWKNRPVRQRSPQPMERPAEELKLTSVASLPLGLVSEGNTGARVHDGGLLDDEAIAAEAGDVAAGVSQRDLVDLVGVQPDFALAALENGRSKALLKFERHCENQSSLSEDREYEEWVSTMMGQDVWQNE